MSQKNYSPIVVQLLTVDLPPLGRGTPHEGVYHVLQNLTDAQLSGEQPVVNQQMLDASRAGLWLLHNYLDQSHAISQDIDSPVGAFWHGIMHRREGDFWNAKYWFRRVGDHPVYAELAVQVQSLLEAESREELLLKLISLGRWNAAGFVDLCESAAADASLAELCRKIQQYEWQCLFDYSYRMALGR